MYLSPDQIEEQLNEELPSEHNQGLLGSEKRENSQTRNMFLVQYPTRLVFFFYNSGVRALPN